MEPNKRRNLWATVLTVTGLGHAACGKVESRVDAAGGGNDDAAIDAPGPANLTVAPLSHQYGPVALSGASAPFTFTFTNTGGNPATGCAAPQKGGAHATDFDITGDTCGTADLPAGASCTVQVSAKPTIAGARTLTLSRICTAGGTASTTADAIVVNEPMYAFVTAAETTGNHGGLAGADAKCQAAGAAGSVSGPMNKTWKALLSQNTGTVVNAKDRFVWTGPLHAMSTVLIVPNPSSWPWTPAVVGNSEIELTENGTQGGSYAWTGSTLNGVASPADCNAWTDGTNAFNGRVGETTFISSATWIDSFTNQCSGTSYALYCISQ